MSRSVSESPTDHQLPAVEPRSRAAAPVDVTSLARVHFRANGLLWDRPELSDAQFLGILADPDDVQYRWAWTRVLERLPSNVITQALSLGDLQRLIRLTRLRPPLQGAWESAIDFWAQEPRGLIS